MDTCDKYFLHQQILILKDCYDKMVKMDARTGSAPYYEPLCNKLIDAFTAKVDIAPRVAFSSFSGKISHAAQSRTDVDETVEDPAQDECEQQATAEINSDAFIASSQNNSKSTKKGYNNNITQNNVSCIS